MDNRIAESRLLAFEGGMRFYRGAPCVKCNKTKRRIQNAECYTCYKADKSLHGSQERKERDKSAKEISSIRRKDWRVAMEGVDYSVNEYHGRD